MAMTEGGMSEFMVTSRNYLNISSYRDYLNQSINIRF